MKALNRWVLNRAAFKITKSPGHVLRSEILLGCLAPADGLGVDDPEFRDKVGEDKITLFRRAGA